MAAEEHTFHVGDTFSSLEELERRIQLFQQHHDIQLYKRRTRTIENTIKRSAKQAKRAFNPAIKFVEVELHCIHGGKKFKSVSTGARPHVKTFQLGCTFSVSLIAAEDGQTLIVHKMNDQHANHISRRIKEEVSHLKIGFIGAGNMAYGIAQGILQPGIIKQGGVKPYIIPDNTERQYYLRTPSYRDLPNLKAKAEACFQAAALATGCRAFMTSALPNHGMALIIPGSPHTEWLWIRGRKHDCVRIPCQNLYGDVIASNVIVSAPSKNNFSRFQAMGVTVTHSNQEVVQNSQLVFLAVKPHLIPTVLSALSEHVTSEHIIVSMAAGVTLATLEELLPGGSCVMRVMPNLPCMLQEGALLLACGTVVKEDMVACLKNLLSSCGLVEVGPESWIDAHTGLSGSGVAFVYVFAEALAEGAVKMGMPSALAQRLAAQTILGAGRLLRDGNKHPAQLKADVCTPGGTTVYGLHALEKGGLRATVIGAVEAATERARELGRK